MAMSKKDYQAIARAIYEGRIGSEVKDGDDILECPPKVTAASIMYNMANALAASNPRFSRALFIEACETGTCKGMKKDKP